MENGTSCDPVENRTLSEPRREPNPVKNPVKNRTP
jgi:hypothetical protein